MQNDRPAAEVAGFWTGKANFCSLRTNDFEVAQNEPLMMSPSEESERHEVESCELAGEPARAIVEGATRDVELPAPLVEPAAASNANALPEFQQLDHRAVSMWRLEGAVVYGALCLLLVTGGTVLWLLAPVPRLAIVAVCTIAFAFMGARIFWWPQRVFARWSYRQDSNTFELRYGVFWHTDVLIPLSRIQHVDTHRNPMERQFGLASVEIHTAGTRDASHRVPGMDIDVARELRDRLVSAANLESSE